MLDASLSISLVAETYVLLYDLGRGDNEARHELSY